MNPDWRKPHYNVIVDFLSYLNSISGSYVLKGGTALMLCYGLTRFSEDIDLDGFDEGIEDIVSNFCSSRGYFLQSFKEYQYSKEVHASLRRQEAFKSRGVLQI